MRHFLQIAAATGWCIYASALSAKENVNDIDVSQCLAIKLNVGQEIGNVFSRTIAIRVDGFDPFVRRVSGTGIYKVKEIASQQIVMQSSFLYDGNPVGGGETAIKDRGRTLCWKGNCSQATDASGVSINPLFWGTPTGRLHVGQTWEVQIPISWELGPPGTQTVKVIAIDPLNDTVTLERKGEGEGESVDERKELSLTKDKKNYVVNMTAGKTRWNGYTTFRHGLILSDELLMERQISITSKDLGQSRGTEREYILLNAAPPDFLRVD